MLMELRTKLLIGATAAFIAASAAAGLIGHIRIAGLEQRIDSLKAEAETMETHAAKLETETHVYKEKIVLLEKRLAEVMAATRLQDAQLEKLAADTDAARRALDRQRRGAKQRN